MRSEGQKIKEQVIKRLVIHAKSQAPVEACGYLAGRDGIITASYELNNMDHSVEHFSFDPKEQFTAMKDARARGLEICAVYHSHPASPARPSAEDIKLAYDPNILYAIISLASGKAAVKMFAIVDGKVEPVELEIDDEGV